MGKKMNPGPLGLLGFGMATILLNIHNLGVIELSLVVIAMGIALGGFAQIIAGILEFKNNNTFAGTAFTAYGLFWLSLTMIWLMPTEYPAFAASTTTTSMGFYLLLWAVFTTFMFIGTLTHNTISKLVFGSLALLFYVLALGDFTEIVLITQIGGVIGIISGLLAMYSAVGQIVNNEFDRPILPL